MHADSNLTTKDSKGATEDNRGAAKDSRGEVQSWSELGCIRKASSRLSSLKKSLLYTTCLKDNFLWGLVRLQKMADIEESMVFVARLLPLQVVPAKLDELLAVCSHAVGQVSHQQRCHLKQLHIDGI